MTDVPEKTTPMETDGTLPASWVIRERSTGRAIFETHNGELCHTLLPEYEMVPIRRYLSELMRGAVNGEPIAETWEWWTSNSWRRLMSPRRGSVQSRAVLMPTVCRDGQPDIVVSPADMALIAAAPDLLALAKQYASECSSCDGTGEVGWSKAEGSPCPDCEDIRAVINKAEGRV